ncbi:DUF2268 domain-containing putative Zn-dependent protease [Deinococcus apachensis]|uniref:DUF2268 domain-containing putative Zn-dependent protease n=1 Tax=Deinococcus apachensis TaxID=309886 RepID=UPI00036302CA|nr:DUF2268 domain-containing putative Zn-dependent protease [Deinococcus apachensis]
MEGLAQHFEVEERGEPLPYARIPDDLNALWQWAQAEPDEPSHSHAAWFFGSPLAGLPCWAGHALGYELVRRFLVFKGGDAVTHADAPADPIRGAWRL